MPLKKISGGGSALAKSKALWPLLSGNRQALRRPASPGGIPCRRRRRWRSPRCRRRPRRRPRTIAPLLPSRAMRREGVGQDATDPVDQKISSSVSPKSRLNRTLISVAYRVIVTRTDDQPTEPAAHHLLDHLPQRAGTHPTARISGCLDQRRRSPVEAFTAISIAMKISSESRPTRAKTKPTRGRGELLLLKATWPN